MVLANIQRIKHIVEAEGNVDDSPVSTVDLINTVDSPAFTNAVNCETGSRVHGIYLHLEVSHTSGTGRPNIYFIIFKNPGANLTAPDPKAVGITDERKYVIHQGMVMMSGDAANGLPRVMFDGVIRIPKLYQRNGIKDKLQLVIRTGTTDLAADFCLQCIYKEFR